MKMQRFITPILILATCASAQAAVQLVSLPSLPLSLPSAVAPEAVVLPGRIAPGAIVLPSPAAPLMPVILPSSPIPMPSIKPGVRLPGPRMHEILPLKMASAVEEPKVERKDDKLNQVFDGRGTRRRTFEIHEDGYHTIPENDLVQEIGIGSY